MKKIAFLYEKIVLVFIRVVYYCWFCCCCFLLSFVLLFLQLLLWIVVVVISGCRFCCCCWYTVKASCKRTWLLFLFFYFPGTVSPIQVFSEFVFLTCGSFSVHPGIKNWLFVHILGSTCEYSTVIASSNYTTVHRITSVAFLYLPLFVFLLSWEEH